MCVVRMLRLSVVACLCVSACVSLCVLWISCVCGFLSLSCECVLRAVLSLALCVFAFFSCVCALVGFSCVFVLRRVYLFVNAVGEN